MANQHKRVCGEAMPCTADTLLIFVDETGHEELAPGHLVYGLGGCAILARDYETAIIRPWRQLRQQILGSPDASLHASDFGRSAKPEDMRLMEHFFRQGRFMRVGTVAAVTTQIDDEIPIMASVIASFKQRILDVAQNSFFDRVSLIVEHSERSNAMVARHFGEFSIAINGETIPTERGFMPKAANEPGLEVADFIAHAVGRQGKQMLVDRRDRFGADFCATFHVPDTRLSSFIAIDEVRKKTS